MQGSMCLERVGFDAPNWHEFPAGLRPSGQQVYERQVGIRGHKWQHEATEAIDGAILAQAIFVQTVRCSCTFAEGDFLSCDHFAP